MQTEHKDNMSKQLGPVELRLCMDIGPANYDIWEVDIKTINDDKLRDS